MLVPANALLFWAPTAQIAWLAVALCTLALAAPIALAPSAIMAVLPNRARGGIIAVASLALTLVGLGVGSR